MAAVDWAKMALVYIRFVKFVTWKGVEEDKRITHYKMLCKCPCALVRVMYCSCLLCDVYCKCVPVLTFSTLTLLFSMA